RVAEEGSADVEEERGVGRGEGRDQQRLPRRGVVDIPDEVRLRAGRGGGEKKRCDREELHAAFNTQRGAGAPTTIRSAGVARGRTVAVRRSDARRMSECCREEERQRRSHPTSARCAPSSNRTAVQRVVGR